jgi:pimeloyl-ACP methyl ester carboxylesterase
MKNAMGGLHTALTAHVSMLYPDGTTVCETDSVDRMYALWKVPRLPPPYLSWWNATDDGRIYRGWESARDSIGELIAKHQPAALLGFSQGAILASVLAALSARGEFPKLEFAVIIAGSMPRAESLSALFDIPIEMPSLHVWGERDALAASRAAPLAERFAEAQRQTMIWPGPHVIPTRGPAAERILSFVATAVSERSVNRQQS